MSKQNSRLFWVKHNIEICKFTLCWVHTNAPCFPVKKIMVEIRMTRLHCSFRFDCLKETSSAYKFLFMLTKHFQNFPRSYAVWWWLYFYYDNMVIWSVSLPIRFFMHGQIHRWLGLVSPVTRDIEAATVIILFSATFSWCCGRQPSLSVSLNFCLAASDCNSCPGAGTQPAMWQPSYFCIYHSFEQDILISIHQWLSIYLQTFCSLP